MRELYNLVNRSKILQHVRSGNADADVRFHDLCGLLESRGFEKRVKGSHPIFRKAGVPERINLQRDGSNAKPCPVKQVRLVLQRNNPNESK